jgi:hypothetical protein
MKTNSSILFTGLLLMMAATSRAATFEGRIVATQNRGGDVQTLRYTIGTNYLRIARGETNRPHARNIFNLQTGDLALVFPHNRSYVRLKPGVGSFALTRPGPPAGGTPNAPLMLTMPVAPGNQGMSSRPTMPAPPGGLPPGIGPQAGAPPGAPSMPGMPGMGAMPMIPMPGMDKLELNATGEKTNLLGYACEKFELQQRGEIMEIRATDQLLPFRAWQPNQPPRFGPQMIEEKWGDALRAKKLFPLLAVLKSGGGGERLRFEVQSITPEKIADQDGTLFQPSADYQELEPLPF